MTALTSALVLSCVALLVTVYWLMTKKHTSNGKELVVVAEIPETSAFGVVLVILGLWMLIGKLLGWAIGGTDAASYSFVAIFGTLLILAGCSIVLISFVKRTIAYSDRLTSYNLFGTEKSIRWSAITGVKVPLLSLAATFSSDTTSISVNGRRKDYLKLAQIARDKVPAIAASDDLARLIRRLAR